MSAPGRDKRRFLVQGFSAEAKNCRCVSHQQFEGVELEDGLDGRVVAACWDRILVKCSSSKCADEKLQIYWCLNGKVRCEKTFASKNFEDAIFMENKLCILASGKINFLKNTEEDSNEASTPETLLSHIWKRVAMIENSEKLYALTSKGELYHINDDIPIWIPLVVRVTQVSCGVSHGVILADNGTVYSWGNGSRGQLGHGCLDDQAKPKLIDILCGLTITSICAGGWHTIALADTGDIYVWGWNSNGQLGFPAPQSSPTASLAINETENCAVGLLNSPKLLELEKYVNCENFMIICSIGCGSRHSAVVTKDGKALTWGWGKYGQLGQKCCTSIDPLAAVDGGVKKRKQESMLECQLPKCGEKTHTPGLVEIFAGACMRATEVHCGGWSTFYAYNSTALS